MKTRDKIIVWIMTALVLSIYALAGYQHYQGEWNIYSDQKAVAMAIDECNNQGLNVSECINDLIEKRVEEPYLKFIKGEAQSQLSRIFDSKNHTLILQANNSLAQIG